jgi:hypothetical protein
MLIMIFSIIGQVEISCCSIQTVLRPSLELCHYARSSPKPAPVDWIVRWTYRVAFQIIANALFDLSGNSGAGPTAYRGTL